MTRTEGTVGGLSWKRIGEGTFGFWDTQGVELRLRNVRQKDGHVHGDLLLYVNNTRTMTRPNVNLTSDRSIPGLEKSLCTAATGADFRVYLEAMCDVLVEQMEKHGVVTRLKRVDPKEIAQPTLFKSRFVPMGALTGVIAHGGVGKSMLGSMLGVSIATGLPVGPFDPLDKGGVLYIDWENDAKMHERRLTRLCMGLGIDAFPDNLIHYSAATSLLSAESELMELAVNEGVILVIIDSIGPAADGDLNKSDVATAFIQAAKRLPGTKIAIGHVSKSQLQGGNERLGPTGHAMFWNGLQAVYDLKATDPDMRGSMTFTLFHNKSNLLEKMPRPLGVHVTFDDPAGAITPSNVTVRGDQPEGAGMRLGQRVYDYLKHRGRSSAKEIAETLNEKEATVAAELRRMRQNNEVVALGGSQGQKGSAQQWGLAADQPATAPLAPVAPAAPEFVPDFELGCCMCGNPEVFKYDMDAKAYCEEHTP
ncbi:MAG: hypothetical protein RLZZ200_1659 [Pseudomonadota bacterium]